MACEEDEPEVDIETIVGLKCRSCAGYIFTDSDSVESRYVYDVSGHDYKFYAYPDDITWPVVYGINIDSVVIHLWTRRESEPVGLLVLQNGDTVFYQSADTVKYSYFR